MATITIGTNATTSLIGIAFAAGISAADLATINAGIVSDGLLAAAVSCTGTTSAASTVILSSATGITAGMGLLGAGLVPGSRIVTISGTTATLNKVATGSAGGVSLLAIPNPDQTVHHLDAAGRLQLPRGRGVISLLPGDYVAVDPATGWPVVISAAAASAGPYTHT